MQIISYISNFFKGHERTVKAKKNILASIVVKGGSMISGFLMVTVLLNYLGQEIYGVWITISSFIVWFSFFEFGLGNGLRNKLGEALAINNLVLAREYVSTTYALLTILVSIVAAVFFVGNQFLNWQELLNTKGIDEETLYYLVSIVFGFFFLQFILKLISTILFADQRPAFANALNPLSNISILIAVYIVSVLFESNILYVGAIFSIIPVIVFLSITVYLFSSRYSFLSPKMKYVNFSHTAALLGLGIKFFIIQVSALVLMQSSSFIIIHYYGPKEVASFQIAFKYFAVANMLFSLILSPYWSAFNDALTRSDINWIKNSIKGLLRAYMGLVLFSFFLLLVSSNIFELWLGADRVKEIQISWTLRVSLMIYFLILSFGGIFNMFINGSGKISLQVKSLVIGTFIFIPLSIFLIKYSSFGVSSVIISSILANFYLYLLAPIQYFKIINNKAYGIWNA